MTKNKKEKGFTYPVVVYVEAVAMANGEIIHYGKTIGFMNERQVSMLEAGATKLTKGSEPVVAVGEAVA